MSAGEPKEMPETAETAPAVKEEMDVPHPSQPTAISSTCTEPNESDSSNKRKQDEVQVQDKEEAISEENVAVPEPSEDGTDEGDNVGGDPTGSSTGEGEHGDKKADYDDPLIPFLLSMSAEERDKNVAKKYKSVASTKTKGAPKMCANCSTDNSTMWRHAKADTEGAARMLLCNACGIYHRKHGIHRPQNKWGILRAPRRRCEPSPISDEIGHPVMPQYVIGPDSKGPPNTMPPHANPWYVYAGYPPMGAGAYPMHQHPAMWFPGPSGGPGPANPNGNPNPNAIPNPNTNPGANPNPIPIPISAPNPNPSVSPKIPPVSPDKDDNKETKKDRTEEGEGEATPEEEQQHPVVEGGYPPAFWNPYDAKAANKTAPSSEIGYPGYYGYIPPPQGPYAQYYGGYQYPTQDKKAPGGWVYSQAPYPYYPPNPAYQNQGEPPKVGGGEEGVHAGVHGANGGMMIDGDKLGPGLVKKEGKRKRESRPRTDKNRQCSNCNRGQTAMWRKSKTLGADVWLCNPCGIYERLYSKMRPQELIDKELVGRSRRTKKTE